MAGIIEYISLNYTWFLGGAIIIILAVIGYYAEKTNFGQGKLKSNDQKKPDLKFGINKKDDLVNENDFKQTSETNDDEILNIQEIFEENSKEDITNNENIEIEDNNINKNDQTGNINEANNEIDSISNINPDTSAPDDFKEKETQKISNHIEENKDQILEDNFDKFEDEFNSIIPEKNIIDGDILEDIDDLSLDKNKNFDFNDIPDLDDVDLPKIRNSKISDNDIWKF